jgi:hypothetical protein
MRLSENSRWVKNLPFILDGRMAVQNELVYSEGIIVYKIIHIAVNEISGALVA